MQNSTCRKFPPTWELNPGPDNTKPTYSILHNITHHYWAFGLSVFHWGGRLISHFSHLSLCLYTKCILPRMKSARCVRAQDLKTVSWQTVRSHKHRLCRCDLLDVSLTSLWEERWCNAGSTNLFLSFLWCGVGPTAVPLHWTKKIVICPLLHMEAVFCFQNSFSSLLSGFFFTWRLITRKVTLKYKKI